MLEEVGTKGTQVPRTTQLMSGKLVARDAVSQRWGTVQV